MHECDDGHDQHDCSEHVYKSKVFTQQPTITENQSTQESAGFRWLQNQQKEPHEDDDDDKDLLQLMSESSDDDCGQIHLDESSDESYTEMECRTEDEKREYELRSGRVDFDYEDDVPNVRPVPQPKNHIRSLITQVWNTVDEEVNAHGPLTRHSIKIPEEPTPLPDPKQVWWTDALPRKKSTVTLRQCVKDYYNAWQSFDSKPRQGPRFPDMLTEDELRVAKREAASLPEKFYKEKGLPVTSPLNVNEWIKHMNENMNCSLSEIGIMLWTWFSGTGNFARIMKNEDMFFYFRLVYAMHGMYIINNIKIYYDWLIELFALFIQVQNHDVNIGL